MRGVLLGCVVLLAAQAAGAAFEPGRWRYYEEISGSADSGYFALQLDPPRWPGRSRTWGTCEW